MIIEMLIVVEIQAGLISTRKSKTMVPEFKEPLLPETVFPPLIDPPTDSDQDSNKSESQNLNNFKDEEFLSRKSRRWEEEQKFPEQAKSLMEAVAGATKALLDPYRILEMVVKSIPEGIRIAGWYLALGVTFIWCVVVLIVGGFATFQALKLIFGASRHIGNGVRAMIRCICNHRKRRSNGRRFIVSN